jgi:glucose/arabinose dehydrogenase
MLMGDRRVVVIALAVVAVVTVVLGAAFLWQTQSEPKEGLSAVPQDVGVSVIAANLDTPWGLVFVPDGRIFFTERPGRLRVIENGGLREEPMIVLPANETAESGALGLEIDPQFPSEPFLYIMYSYDSQDGIRNRIVRLTVEGNSASVDRVLIEGIPGSPIHNGGRVKIGPDGKLYATTGDGAEPSNAQNLNSLGGKILRLNLDGSIPEDNPFPGSSVYTYGHRNPQGLDWQPGTGRLYATEHGATGNDEVNLIEPGRNYGWPEREGEDHAGFTAPVIVFNPSIAPGGAVFFEGSSVSQWQDSFFFATLRGQHLHRLKFDVNNPVQVIENERLYDGEFGRLRDVVQGPDGALYITTSNRDGRGSPAQNDDRILRIGPSTNVANNTASTSAENAMLLYPDLRTVQPRDLVLTSADIDGASHYVLRFTNTIWNAGQGPLELQEQKSDGKSQVYQNIYDSQGNTYKHFAGAFVFHPEHNHWHFENQAHFELWTKDSYQRWLDSGRREGSPAWQISKTSVCMLDTQKREELPQSPEERVYRTCTSDIQGISVGWADIYEWDLEDQWVDLGFTPLSDGSYVLRSIADPNGLIEESPNAADSNRESPEVNEATLEFTVRNGEVSR